MLLINPNYYLIAAISIVLVSLQHGSLDTGTNGLNMAQHSRTCYQGDCATRDKDQFTILYCKDACTLNCLCNTFSNNIVKEKVLGFANITQSRWWP